jgi:hypothetical protein
MAAWIPFLSPAPGASRWWWLLMVPMSILICMAWKAVRQDDMRGYWAAVTRMSAQVILAMIGMFVALAAIVQFLVPQMPAE